MMTGLTTSLAEARLCRKGFLPGGWGQCRHNDSPTATRNVFMRAAEVVAYQQPVKLVEVPDPKIVDPYDVIGRLAGAGVCRTDIHIMQGGLEAAFHPKLPFTLAHENARRVA